MMLRNKSTLVYAITAMISLLLLPAIFVGYAVMIGYFMGWTWPPPPMNTTILLVQDRKITKEIVISSRESWGILGNGSTTVSLLKGEDVIGLKHYDYFVYRIARFNANVAVNRIKNRPVLVRDASISQIENIDEVIDHMTQFILQ